MLWRRLEYTTYQLWHFESTKYSQHSFTIKIISFMFPHLPQNQQHKSFQTTDRHKTQCDSTYPHLAKNDPTGPSLILRTLVELICWKALQRMYWWTHVWMEGTWTIEETDKQAHIFSNAVTCWAASLLIHNAILK